MNSRILAASITIAAINIACHASADTLQLYANIKPDAISESSGIVKSRQFEDVYWTHNDSGDSARIFAITRDGEAIQTDWAQQTRNPYEGIPIGGAVNIDWEDVATDNQGNLLIAACGNNENARRDLALYILPEPDPRFVWKTRIHKRIDFHYPDQKKFPDPENKNFDCEALFYANGKPYFVSKNRSMAPAKLYRMDATDPNVSNPLTLMSSYDLRAQVTAADVTADGKKLAILTYAGCWVFIKPDGSDNYFEGQAFYTLISAKQCEAICWDDEDTLIITNEQGELLEIDLAAIPEFKR